MKTILWMLSFIAAASVLAPAQQQMSIQALSLDQATQYALQYNPSIAAAQANRVSASAGVTVAASSYYPQISAVASAVRNDGAFVFNPNFPPTIQTYNNYTSGLQLNANLFDFGRTINRVSASGSLEDAAAYDFDAARENVVEGVALAYFTLEQSMAVVKVDEEAVSSAEQHLKQAQAFYSVGRVARFDVTRAEVDLANANVTLITARNLVSVNRLQLENAMGIRATDPYVITDTLAVELFASPLDSVRSIAMGRRPDVLSTAARVEADRALARAAWEQNLPSLSFSGTWNWTGFNFPLYSRFTGGVTLSLPLFQGFAVSAQTEQARSAAEAAQANLDQLNQSVKTEVEQDYLSLREADERLGAVIKLVQQADENLLLAEKQYAAGVASEIDVTDAQLTRSNAHITQIQALFDYNSDLVRLKRSMGVLGK